MAGKDFITLGQVGVGFQIVSAHFNSKNRRYSASFSSCNDSGVAVANVYYRNCNPDQGQEL
jgi:hypothetical protein